MVGLYHSKFRLVCTRTLNQSVQSLEHPVVPLLFLDPREPAATAGECLQVAHALGLALAHLSQLAHERQLPVELVKDSLGLIARDLKHLAGAESDELRRHPDALGQLGGAHPVAKSKEDVFRVRAVLFGRLFSVVVSVDEPGHHAMVVGQRN